MWSLELVKLTALMQRTQGNPAVRIGLIDGPVTTSHPDLSPTQSLTNTATCSRDHSLACRHGTYIAGILAARRASSAPAICPGCTLLLRPVFTEAGHGDVPTATPLALAGAILECIAAGAQLINLSLALAPLSSGTQALQAALDYALQRQVVLVVASGNYGEVGGSVLTRHPCAVPVVACDTRGVQVTASNLGNSIGLRGLRAPGQGVDSLGSGDQAVKFNGTSVAVPFVTGAFALLLSIFPTKSAAQVRLALGHASPSRRTSIVPPLLNAEAAHQYLSITQRGN